MRQIISPPRETPICTKICKERGCTFTYTTEDVREYNISVPYNYVECPHCSFILFHSHIEDGLNIYKRRRND